MFHRSIVWIVTASALAIPSKAQGFNQPPDIVTTYTPSEVGLMNAHPAQKLSLFRPTRVCPPQDTGRWPVLLYSPASMFGGTEAVPSLEEGFGEFPPLTSIPRFPPPLIFPGPLGGFHSLSPPPGSNSGLGFLSEAIARGWAVVTVGTTGWNSWQACGQKPDCVQESMCNKGSNPGCSTGSGCWDTNLWYKPCSAEWDNPNLFWGEKEFLWARQWVAQNAAAWNLDNGRVVVCGTSTGAIYASFLAFGPNRAWDGSYSFSQQSQQDTRVAGIVAFEPVIWMKAMPSVTPAPHWPSDSTGILCGVTTGSNCFGLEACYNRRAKSTGLDSPVAPGVLEQSSISRWVREIEDDESPTPAFIAAGDGAFTTGFTRDASLYPTDYDRSAGVSGCPPYDPMEGDPVLAFASSPALALHDSWHAMNFILDLIMLDEENGNTFHQDNSQLYLQEGHDWSNLPSWLSTTGLPPQTAEEVLYLEGTYEVQGTSSSIDNTDLAPKVVDWMEEVLDIQRTNGVLSRNPPLVGPFQVANNNPSIYSSEPLVKGEQAEVEINLNGAPGYELASVLVFTSSSAPGTELVLSGGQALLCDIGSFYLSSPFTGPDPLAPPGIVHVTLGPASPACLSFCTQAILVDVQHAMPFALTNAVDFIVQR